MKVTLFAFLFSSLFLTLTAQNFRQNFAELMDKEDWEGAQKVLVSWENESPDDPDLTLARYDLALEHAKEWETLPPLPPPPGSPPSDAHNGPIRVYLLDSAKTWKAIMELNSVFSKHPCLPAAYERKLNALHSMREWEALQETMVEMVEQLERKDCGENSQEILAQIEEYGNIMHRLRFTYEDYPRFLEKIGKRIVEIYPNHAHSYLYLGSARLIKYDFSPAYNYLKKANELAPDDPLILIDFATIVLAYGNKKKAIQYFERVLEIGGPLEKREAMNWIRSMEEDEKEK